MNEHNVCAHGRFCVPTYLPASPGTKTGTCVGGNDDPSKVTLVHRYRICFNGQSAAECEILQWDSWSLSPGLDKWLKQQFVSVIRFSQTD